MELMMFTFIDDVKVNYAPKGIKKAVYDLC